jgi:5'-3' exonuclease
MKKVLLIDLGHLAHRYLFVKAADIQSVGFNMLRHLLLANGIFPYINQFSPDAVYIGIDYKKSWRKDKVESYKANRADAREKKASVVDWNGFYKFMDEFVIELQEVFPFYAPVVPQLEADDIIGWLARTLPANYEKTIITGDTDYIQLLKYPNTKLWTPNKRDYVKEDPEQSLLIKIICGDSSDNIPGVRRGLGVKKAAKLIASGELPKLITEVDSNGKLTEFAKNFERNKSLIDLEQVPKEFIDKLQDQMVNYKLADGKKLFRYLIDRNLREMFENIEKYKQLMKPLIAHSAASSAE